MTGFEEMVFEDFSLLSHSDPVVLELNKLQNQLKENERELGKAQTEIRALRASEVLKEKAVEELGSEVKRLEEKLRFNENLVEQKNLDIKRLKNEKKEALAAQFAAEATLRRVYADQKDDDSVPIESIIAPLEAELKICKNELAAAQEDKRALERLTKSKESALLEAERILTSALERALIVEEVQNQNFELRRQIEICQEENKILEKTNRQKVVEVEKLSQTITELEEAILAGGEAANTVREYKRKISELNDEKRILERELARIKVSASRVASVMANEWKDDNDKVMPVKQWLEERRLLQADVQKLKDKLVISERTAKAEAQVKEKLKLRLKTLEEGFKHASNASVTGHGSSPKNEKSSHSIFGILSSNSKTKKRASSQPRGSTIARSSLMITDCDKQTRRDTKKTDDSLLKKNLWAPRNKIVDRSEKENAETDENRALDRENRKKDEVTETKNINKDDHCEDLVSGFLYDRLQKEVLSLRKSCDLKENTLKSKDEEIKILMKKVETLSRAMEVESKKVKREAAIRERDSSTVIKTDAEKIKNTNSSNGR